MQVILFIFLFVVLLTLVIDGISTTGIVTEERCPFFEFRCSNGKCLPRPFRCDGKDDCGDNSDERICRDTSDFRCIDGVNIPKSQLCDGKADCQNDEDPVQCEKHKCSQDQFLCRTIPMTCINITNVCDNVKHCPDNSDESYDACKFLSNSKIVQCDSTVQFRCKSKDLCISKVFICDGNYDCLDKSDEDNCTVPCTAENPCPKSVNNITENPCTKDEFYCGPTSPAGCISKEWVCDSSLDCSGTGIDEKSCSNFKCPVNMPYKCNTVERCYDEKRRCDGYRNCEDNSDEKFCPISHLKCDEKKEFKCAKKDQCIPLSKLCDKTNDCGDNSDEEPLGDISNCQKNHCTTSNGGCEHICVNFFHERKCFCNPGYRNSLTDETKCIDIDECKENKPCSHKCINTEGSYVCECFDGFTKSLDKQATCTAVGEKFLLYTSGNSIRELRLIHHHLEELTPLNQPKFLPVGIDFDYKSGRIFWSQLEPHPEMRFLRHSDIASYHDVKNLLLQQRIHSPVSIAYDWIHDLLFWTDSHFNEISVMNGVRNYNRKTLLKLPSQSKIMSIVVHPSYRRIYWSDWGEKPRIESIGMDGKDRQVIIEDGIRTPNGLAIDYYLNELYWVDARDRSIKACNLKTLQTRTVVTYLEAYGFSLDIFEDWLYLSDWHNHNIIKIHKVTGDQKVLVSSPKPMGIKLMHELAQPKDIENACAKNTCQYFCLPVALSFLKNQPKFRCDCPDNSELLSDNTSCTTPPKGMYNTTIQRRIMPISVISVHRINVSVAVSLVTLIVILLLIFAITVGVLIYRNYVRRVVKQVANFNNPIYFKSRPSEVDFISFEQPSEQHEQLISLPRNQNDAGISMTVPQ